MGARSVKGSIDAPLSYFCVRHTKSSSVVMNIANYLDISVKEYTAKSQTYNDSHSHDDKG